MLKIRSYTGLLLGALCLTISPFVSKAYSVLTHEAIVDASWEKSIVPLLKLKYAGTSDSALLTAHAYAYGGAIAPDMGYFPFGSKLFTNLVHYVRSGDFVMSLLHEAKDVNDYAFALGFLCHYMADKHGHFIATNRCVPIVYPKIREKFGRVVTYEQDKTSHKRLEFSFDVLQIANGNYATKAYHDFIGFQVARPLLERAFVKTYGVDINSIFGSLSLSIESFRLSVKNLFPALTRAAWAMKKNEILKMQPTATSRSFRYKMKRANYYQEFGRKHHKPGVVATTLGWLVRILPKVGPLKSLKLKAPGPVAEKLFIQSFDTTLARLNGAVKLLRNADLDLANIDFDTGKQTGRGEYNLADVNYDNLLLKLDDNKFRFLSAGLKKNIIAFYSSPFKGIAVKKNDRHCNKISVALQQLKMLQPL
jgi:hypothetical protein